MLFVRDEDDGVLVSKEAEVEKTAIEQAVQEFQVRYHTPVVYVSRRGDISGDTAKV